MVRQQQLFHFGQLVMLLVQLSIQSHILTSPLPPAQ